MIIGAEADPYVQDRYRLPIFYLICIKINLYTYLEGDPHIKRKYYTRQVLCETQKWHLMQNFIGREVFFLTK